MIYIHACKVHGFLSGTPCIYVSPTFRAILFVLERGTRVRFSKKEEEEFFLESLDR